MLLVKHADQLGGQPTQQFERSFAELGLAYIQDSAPELIDHLIGFQLVNRSDDNTKALGVFGFDLGGTLAYAPAVFTGGEIKGNEVLLLKDLDLCVPLSESWINYLLSQFGSKSLGSSMTGTPQQLGMMPPNIMPITRPPIMSKRGSVYPSVPSAGWHSSIRPFAPFYAALTQDSLEKSGSTLLGKSGALGIETGALLNKLLRTDPAYVKMAMDICDRYPAVGHYWRKFHGSDVFEKALLDQQPIYKAASSPAPDMLRRPDYLGDHAGLGSPYSVDFHIHPEPWMEEKQAQELARQGYLVEDSRPLEKLSAAATQRKQSLVNPTETGIYQLLTKGGTFVRTLIIIAPKGQREDKSNAIAVKIDGEGYISTSAKNLFVKLPAESREDFLKWIDGRSGSSLDSGSKYVLVSPSGEGSVAFRVYSKGEDDSYEVWPEESCGCGGSWDGGYNDYHGKSLDFVRKREGRKFRFWDGTLEAPSDSISIKLSGSDLEPGTLLDADMAVIEKTASLHIRVDGPEASINRQPATPKFAALKSLVFDHGFSVSDARDLLKQAEMAGRVGNHFTARVVYGEASRFYKSAAPQGPGGLLNADGISAPPFPEPDISQTPWSSGAMEQTPMEHTEQVGGLGAAYNDPSTYDQSPESIVDPMMMQQAQQAGASGQKELFDTSMLSQLSKGVRPQSRIQEWTRDLVQAMDRLGRILLLFYWHNDEFADRYGKNDLPDLEDAIRNAFDSLGEVALFLKEKDVEPLGGLQMGEASVDQIAN